MFLKFYNYILKDKLDVYYIFIEERKIIIFNEWNGKGKKILNIFKWMENVLLRIRIFVVE